MCFFLSFLGSRLYCQARRTSLRSGAVLAPQRIKTDADNVAAQLQASRRIIERCARCSAGASSETGFKLKALLSFSLSKFETACFQAGVKLAPAQRSHERKLIRGRTDRRYPCDRRSTVDRPEQMYHASMQFAGQRQSVEDV